MQWRVTQVARTGSTQVDVATMADDGQPAGLVLIAEEQSAGRGRLERSWTTEKGRGIAMSLLLRPHRDVTEWGWLPLVVGAAVVEAIDALGAPASLKWPNDVLVNDRKVAGILVEQRPEREASPGGLGDAAIVGIGINLLAPERVAEPLLVQPIGLLEAIPDAQLGTEADTEPIASVLRTIAEWLDAWEAGDDERLRGMVRDRCSTLGRAVRVLLPSEEVLEGTAAGLSDRGELLVNTDGPEGPTRTVAAGDVVHLR
jgi:BirA family biotin operon repressor/biotin-[acetyl-CoA-carboxylase] ligase